VTQPDNDVPRAAESERRRDELADELARVTADLERIEVLKAETQCRLDQLRSQLMTLDGALELESNSPRSSASLPTGIALPVTNRASEVKSPTGGPQTPTEKVKLFRSLFRGREDVYATRFVSKKTSRPGYAPACSNKFVPGVCDLPKVKCGDCTNQAFLPVDDAAILAHLRGQHVMGVYPMLADETCWFLAIDFDKHSYLDDVRAVVQTCRRLDVPFAVERSRSGNGAHVWFFFSAPVVASTARQFGSLILTRTMSERHELGMDSYDRLFPNQDTMPRGGFGNLIALPLQYGPRKEGNSVFLDDEMATIADDEQWTHLYSIRRIDPSTIERLVDEAIRTDGVLGVRSIDNSDEEDATPWATSPSRARSLAFRPDCVGDLPDRVRAVLAQRLFVEKAGLPSRLVDQIKRIAAFQNPEFFKKQGMRLSTALTPRVISCAEDLPCHVALPRGCVNDLNELLRIHGIALDVVDERVSGEPLEVQFRGELTPVQKDAARAILAHDIGVFVAPPGTGKTVLGTYLVAERGCNALVLVHRRPLLDQWRAQLSLFLGLEPREIGQIGTGKRRPTGTIDVAMVQSLVKKDSVDEVVANYGQVIVDECHHVPAVSFERVLASLKARYIVGLTATPRRRDGHHPIAEMQLGPVRFRLDARSQAGRRPFEHRLIVRETGFRADGVDASLGVQELYALLARDEARNRMILDDILMALEEHRSPILLTERREHLEMFAERLSGFARNLIVLQGGMSSREGRESRERLASIPADEERLIIATGRYIGEGFDDSRLDTLFLAMPVSWRGTLVQYAGRLHRLHPGKQEVKIYDYADNEVPMLRRMFEKRLRGYQAIGYRPGVEPLGHR
jgi:superfamily II DNA or RNA helicase